MAPKKKSKAAEGPSPISVINEHIKSGTFSRIYLLTGECRYLLNQFRDKLIDAAADRNDGMSFLQPDMDSYDEEMLISDASTLPFFSDHKVISVKYSGFFNSKHEALADFLGSVPESTILIFTEDKVNGTLRTTKQAKKCGTFLEFNNPTDRDMISWIAARFKERGLGISGSNASMLMDICEGDMMRIAGEIDKLSAYAMGTSGITAEDIALMSGNAVSDKIFDLAHAISRGDKALVMNIYGDLIKLNKDPQELLGALIFKYKQLLSVNEMLESGRSPFEIGRALHTWDKVTNVNIEICRYYGRERLLTIYTMCMDAIVSSRSKGSTKRSAQDAVDLLILQLMQI